MTKNMSTIDRIVRVIAAVAALAVAIAVGAGSAVGVLLLVVAVVMGVTAAVGFCPLYSVFHFDSRGRRSLPH